MAMANSEMDVNKFEDEFLTCTLCLDSFTKPKILPCLHSFCCVCLQTYVNQLGEVTSFNCPVCRIATVVPDGGVSGFKDNFYIQNVKEFMKSKEPQSQDPNANIASGSEPESKSSGRRTRNSAKKFKKEQVDIELSDCKVHKGYRECMFCARCKIRLCPICSDTNHKLHMQQVSTIHVYVEKQISKLLLKKQWLQECFKIRQEMIHDLNKQLASETTNKENCKLQLDGKAIDLLRHFETSLKAHVDLISKKIEHEYVQQQEQKEKKIDICKDEMNKIDYIFELMKDFQGTDHYVNLLERTQISFKHHMDVVNSVLKAGEAEKWNPIVESLLNLDDIHDVFKHPDMCTLEVYCRTSELKPKHQHYSRPYQLRGHQWCLFVEHIKSDDADTLGAYVKCMDISKTPVKAKWDIILLNFSDPTKIYKLKCEHAYTEAECDWGFAKFFAWQKLVDPAKGFTKNGFINIKAERTAVDD